MEMKPLYLRSGDQVAGPFEAEQVRRDVRQGKLTPAHEGSVEGQSWFHLETIWRDLVDEPASPAEASGAPNPEPEPADDTIVALPAVTVAAAPTPRGPPPLPEEPKFFEADASAAAVEFPSWGDAPVDPWAHVLTTSAAPPEGPADSAAPAPYAPAYIPALFGVLQIVLLFSGVLYAGVALNSLFVIIAKQSTRVYLAPEPQMFGAVMQVAMIVGAVLFDVVMGIVLMLWLRNVFARIRVFQKKVGSDSFSTWAVGYFIPVATAFTFSKFLSRIWNASYAGKRTKGARTPKPEVVFWSSLCRSIVWTSYLGLVLLVWWFISLVVELGQAKRDLRYRWDSPERAQAAADSFGRVAGEISTAETVLLGMLILAASASAAVMFFTYRYAKTVHLNMMAIQDSDNVGSADAPST
jgi:hypothetical protein